MTIGPSRGFSPSDHQGPAILIYWVSTKKHKSNGNNFKPQLGKYRAYIKIILTLLENYTSQLAYLQDFEYCPYFDF